jgi:magnesium-transporting ATPase (P-type)
MTQTPKTNARKSATAKAAVIEGLKSLRDPHGMDTDDVLATLGAGERGLTEAEAAELLARHGPNRLPEPPKRSAILRFLSHFHNVLIYVLLGAAVITAGLGHYIDTGVILAVVIANAIIGFIQEGRAEQACCATANGAASTAPRLFPATSCCWKRARKFPPICG